MEHPQIIFQGVDIDGSESDSRQIADQVAQGVEVLSRQTLVVHHPLVDQVAVAWMHAVVSKTHGNNKGAVPSLRRKHMDKV